MTRERGIIVGGGAAAHAFVDGYREAGGEADLLLVTQEDHLPYFRPLLTKEYLRGEVGVDKLPLDDPDWYGEHGVDLRLGCAAEALDVREHSLLLAGGEALRWDACVLALGSRARPLPVAGADQPGVHSIRSAADGDRLVAAARPGREIVVVGSGFIGCEAAASLQARGCRVTMVGPEQVPQEERLGPEVGTLLAEWLSDLGVTVRLGPLVHEICRDGQRWAVELEGATVPRRPRRRRRRRRSQRRAGRAGRDSTSTAASSWTPSCARRPRTCSRWVTSRFAWNEAAGRRLRVEHWGDAEAMADVAAKTLAGTPASWRSVPGFWSVIGDRTLKLAAWGDGWNDATVRQDDEGFTAWYGRDGTTVGVLTHDHDADLERGTSLVESGAPFPP